MPCTMFMHGTHDFTKPCVLYLFTPSPSGTVGSHDAKCHSGMAMSSCHVSSNPHCLEKGEIPIVSELDKNRLDN